MKYKKILTGFLLLSFLTPILIADSQNMTIKKFENDSLTIIIQDVISENENKTQNGLFTYILIPLITLFSALIGFGFKHFLEMRKEKLRLEIEIRREVKDFFVCLYGHISILTELINGYHRAIEFGTTRIINKSGFPELSGSDIFQKFEERYTPFSSFIWENREKGIEIYFSKELADKMADFYAYIDTFHEIKEFEEKQLNKFQIIADGVMKELEKTLGIPRKRIQIFD